MVNNEWERAAMGKTNKELSKEIASLDQHLQQMHPCDASSEMVAWRKDQLEAFRSEVERRAKLNQ